MGRMADARKRARRAAEPGAPVPEPSAARASGVAPRLEPAPGAEPDAHPDFVFPAESVDEPVPAADERLSLPSSGLAEEILAKVEAPGAGAQAKIELPTSGLAEDILAQHPSAAVEPVPQAPAPAAAPSPEPAAGGGGAHSLSFFAAPAQEQRVAVEATEHLATFYLDREEYGVDVRQVQEIRRLTEVTTVPRAPDFIRGVINLRGRILPVLDLRAKLGLGEVAESRAARIIVVRVRERILGLLVDGASQVLKVPVSQIEPPPEEVVERGGDYIRGVAKLDERLIILVDLERLLAHELRAASGPAAGARAALGTEA
jgi:purine-binding chemotaxis protein CheW